MRPRKEDDWDEVKSQASSNDDEVEEQGVRPGRDDDSEQESEDDEQESRADSEVCQTSDLYSQSSNRLNLQSDDDEPPAPKVDLASISFGALAKAQESLPSRRSKTKTKSDPAKTTSTDTAVVPPPRKTSRPSREDLKRSSKHAPQEQTSTRPVSRRREVVPDANPRRQHRDPRFDPLVSRLDEAKAQKSYAFLDEYREKEMADLRVQIKKTRNADAKERLKRELMSMEGRKKAKLRREQEEELLKEHRQKEKDLVAQGKQPFYLKKSEQKKQLLVNRYETLSKGQVDRAIERKRKKVAGKEKKELDYLQRSRPRG